MEIYKEPELNQIANEIREDIHEYGLAIENMMKRPPDENSSKAEKFVQNIWDNPAVYISELFYKNEKKLIILKNKYSENDTTYKVLSDGLAVVVLSIINWTVSDTNLALQCMSIKELNKPENLNVKKNFTECASFLNAVNNLKASPNTKFQIIEMQNRIKSIEKRINPKIGCYIATFVYGDYDKIEVIKLRLFRDRFLAKTIIGRHFIDLYYIYSPILIEKYSNNKVFKFFSKQILDLFLKFLK